MARNSPYLVSGFTRHVKPYIYEFKTYAKGRWIGKPLLDVLTTEFGGFDVNYWKNAIHDKNILVNNSPTTESYIVRNSDELIHRTHRHEPPVFGTIQLVGITDELIAVNKPASMPMHPCGGYKYNTLLTILAEEPFIPDQPQLFTVHRLDRVTSGLVILAKSNAIANKISMEIRSNQTEKVYLARVKGRFPSRLDHLKHLTLDQLLLPTESDEVKKEIRKSGKEEHILSKKRSRYELSPNEPLLEPTKLRCVEAACGETGSGSPSTPETPVDISASESDCVGYGFSSVTGELLVRYPIAVVSHREGVHKCDISGKQSLSGFKFLGYRSDDDTSLIECRPHTGRTHQLRLHLQLLGNPIANDPCYGGTLFYGQHERRGIATKIAEKLLHIKEESGGRLVSNMPHLHSLVSDTVSSSSSSRSSASDPEKSPSDHLSSLSSSPSSSLLASINLPTSRHEGESEESYLIRNCRYCKQREYGGVTAEEEALVHCDSIWLHARKYQGTNWMFETSPPEWGQVEEFPEKEMRDLHLGTSPSSDTQLTSQVP